MIIIVKYNYPDKNDLITHKLVDHINAKSLADSWDREEEEILELFLKMKGNRSSILDAGCGTGRLISKYKDYFKEITAVESDPSRFEKSMNLIESLKLESKINFQLCKIQDLDEDKKFDTIICSHVLQHISTMDCENIVKKFSKIINPKGLLLILVSRSEISKDVFTKLSHVREEIISVNEFNKLTEVSYFLPVRKFAKESIQSLVIEYGFRVIKCDSYHSLEREKKKQLNPRTESQYVNIDLYLIAEKL